MYTYTIELADELTKAEYLELCETKNFNRVLNDGTKITICSDVPMTYQHVENMFYKASGNPSKIEVVPPSYHRREVMYKLKRYILKLDGKVYTFKNTGYNIGDVPDRHCTATIAHNLHHGNITLLPRNNVPSTNTQTKLEDLNLLIDCLRKLPTRHEKYRDELITNYLANK